jgi:hypothetical protein
MVSRLGRGHLTRRRDNTAHWTTSFLGTGFLPHVRIEHQCVWAPPLCGALPRRAGPRSARLADPAAAAEPESRPPRTGRLGESDPPTQAAEKVHLLRSRPLGDPHVLTQYAAVSSVPAALRPTSSNHNAGSPRRGHLELFEQPRIKTRITMMNFTNSRGVLQYAPTKPFYRSSSRDKITSVERDLLSV